MNTCSQQQQEQQLHESSVNRLYECKPVKMDIKYIFQTQKIKMELQQSDTVENRRFDTSVS